MTLILKSYYILNSISVIPNNKITVSTYENYCQYVAHYNIFSKL